MMRVRLLAAMTEMKRRGLNPDGDLDFQIERELDRVAGLVRAGSLSLDELADGMGYFWAGMAKDIQRRLA